VQFGDDVVAGQVRPDFDQVQGVEPRGTQEVARTDHVDLMGRARPHIDGGRIRHPFGHVARLAATRLGHARPGQDPFDRARWWDLGHPDPAQLPLDRQRPLLGSGVGDQPGPSSQDQRLEPGWGARRGPMRGP